jgi:hypothetical protein
MPCDKKSVLKVICSLAGVRFFTNLPVMSKISNCCISSVADMVTMPETGLGKIVSRYFPVCSVKYSSSWFSG